jgi:hypothetical protein
MFPKERHVLRLQQHFNGKGGPVDYAAAAKWLKLAADQGFAAAATTYLPVALNLLFPLGTFVELVGLKVVSF